jgi:hypothetical protein
MQSSGVAEPCTLTYGPRPRWHRRWPWFRSIFSVLITSASLIFMIWGRQITRKSALLYHQHQCLTYIAPENQVVFDEDPQAAADLLARSAEYESFVPVHPFSRAAVTHTPRCWTSFEKLAWGAAAPQHKHVLFLHELRTSNGMRRLVCVILNCEGRFKLESIVINPADLTNAPSNARTPITVIIGRGSRPHVVMEPREKHIRFYAGQIQRDDPSKFYIRYELDLQEHYICGRLNHDGTDVILDFQQNWSWLADWYWTPKEQEAVLKALQSQQVTPSPPSTGILLAEPPDR